jgi:type IV secretion system protein VirB9
MKRALALSAAALLCQFGAAYALQIPQPAAKGGDPHVQVAPYNPAQQTLIVGAVGRPVTITFAPSEHIRRVILETGAVIDGKSVPPPWDGPTADQIAQQPLGNVLPLWAMRAGRSNAQVVTGTEDGANRVYQFALLALPPQPNDCGTDDCDDPRLTTGLTFTYPQDRAKKVDLAAMRARQAEQKLAAEARVKTDIFYGQRNWRYVAKGNPDMVKRLAPDQISDNTQVTGFLYNGNRHVPAIYIVQPDGTERQMSPVPNRGLFLVYETAQHWRLRDGSDVVDL